MTAPDAWHIWWEQGVADKRTGHEPMTQFPDDAARAAYRGGYDSLAAHSAALHARLLRLADALPHPLGWLLRWLVD
jgi:hypothetical protein